MGGPQLTGLRLPQAAFRDLVPGRSYHASTGVVIGTRAACGKRMLWAVLFVSLQLPICLKRLFYRLVSAEQNKVPSQDCCGEG